MVKIWKVVWGWFEWDRATRRLVAGNVREALEKADKIKVVDHSSTKLDIISIELESESDEEAMV